MNEISGPLYFLMEHTSLHIDKIDAPMPRQHRVPVQVASTHKKTLSISTLKRRKKLKGK
jgi:hypothetical protein